MDTAAALEVNARRLTRARCKINIAVVGYRRKLGDTGCIWVSGSGHQ